MSARRVCALVACVLTLLGCAPAPASLGPGALTDAVEHEGDPGIVAIVESASPTVLRCTGALVTVRVVLTAAHCFEGLEPQARAVFVGPVLGGPGTLVPIVDVELHPERSELADHDLALVLLDDAVPVDPLRLPGAVPLEPALPARLVGYGVTGPDAADATRKREGRAVIGEVLEDQLVLAGDPSLPCHGDSGGPVLVPGPAGEELAAVISRGDRSCASLARAARVDVDLDAFVQPALAAWEPGAIPAGAPCVDDELCEGGLCLAAADEPGSRFCGARCEGPAGCAAPLACDPEGLCRYPFPSPGAVGATCTAHEDCVRGDCLAERGVCGVRCVPGDEGACPPGAACTHLGGVDFYCVRPPPPSSGCAVSGTDPHAPGAMLLAALAGLAIRRRRP
jgi:MYXO-CTERM domain-containing protein